MSKTQLTAGRDTDVEDGAQDRRPRLRGGPFEPVEAQVATALGRRRRPHHWGRWVVLLLVVLLVLPAWSVVGALTAPGTDTTTARLAEWARFNHLGWAVNGLEQVQYQIDKPKDGGSLAGGIPSISVMRPSSSHPTRPTSHLKHPSKRAVHRPSPPRRPASNVPAPAPVPSQARPSLREEGVWQPVISLNGEPAIRAAFLRPDAQHTSYLVGVAWLNQKLVKLALHPGFHVPGGWGLHQPSKVPASRRSALVATFNSGFTMVDANGGYWQDGKTIVPLRQGAASIVFYKDGHVDVVRWNASSPGADVAAVRQNLGLLVDHGAITPEVDSTTTMMWGATLGNKTYVWRSALGIRRDGSLVFVAGASMSVRTLANIVHDAGAVRALELDINPAWTNFMTYTHPSKGVAVPHMLTSDMQANPYRYLQPSSRDFVAVLAR